MMQSRHRKDSGSFVFFVVVSSKTLSVSFYDHQNIEEVLIQSRLILEQTYPNVTYNIVGLRSRRLERDLLPKEVVKDVVEIGDFLDAKTYVASIHSSGLRELRESGEDISLNQYSGKPGLFTVTLIRARNLRIPTKFGLSRAFISAQLLPYDPIVNSNSAIAPDFAWNFRFHFVHDDPKVQKIMLQIKLYADPPLGQKVMLGSLIVPLQYSIQSPGILRSSWVNIVQEQNHWEIGKLHIATCFHPKVAAGRTLKSLLKNAAKNKQNHLQTSIQNAKISSKHQYRHRIGKDVSQAQKKNPIGQFSIKIDGIHLCGPQCSKIDGHSSISYPDFSPIISIKFDENTAELQIRSNECDSMRFSQEWPVYSSFSAIDIEILKKAQLNRVSGNSRRLNDGKSAIKICGLSISCHDIQERDAAKWTFLLPKASLGPGKKKPLNGYEWISLYQGDEEAGLAHISVRYIEDIKAILDQVESGDIGYVHPDEKRFDPAIIQRNFERLDELFKVFKDMKTSVQEILDWKCPTKTLAIWIMLNISCIYLPTEHIPVIPIGMLIWIMLINCIRFMRGNNHKKWIYHIPGNSFRLFRSVAKLRVVPLSAHNLISQSNTPENHSEAVSKVRIFYEPNYQKVPVQLVGQTNGANDLKNPVWNKIDANEVTSVDTKKSNNKWLMKKHQHLNENENENENILHDIVEPWQRRDRGFDDLAFMFPILQAVQTDRVTGEDELIPWNDAPGTIRFDVVHYYSTGMQHLVGRVRIPVKHLVTNEGRGGAQEELESNFVLATASKSSYNAENNTYTIKESEAMLRLRIQLYLRDPEARVTLKEKLTSEALYNAIEMENERELSLVEKYHKAKDVAKNIQQTLGQICSRIERFKNLFLWTHPIKSLAVLCILIVSFICSYFIPVRYIVLYSTAKKFTKKFHGLADRDTTRLLNLVNSIPSDLDLKKVYRWKNLEFLKLKEHTETQAKLRAEWAGYLWKQGDGVLCSWQERYSAIRSGKLEFWQSLSDAKSGAPPKSSMNISNIVEKFTTIETTQIPKGSYPFIVFDISSYGSSNGRRRIICSKSEEDFYGVMNAIIKSGEPRSSSDELYRSSKSVV